jgi:hypothetical protein
LTYLTNRSKDDAISIALYTALSQLDKRNTYVKMLFIDYSSAFNTIVLSKLITQLRTLGLNTSLSNWILDFLTSRPQVVRVGNNTSVMLILNTGPLRGASSVPSCTRCSRMTAQPGTTPTPSLSLLMTQQW